VADVIRVIEQFGDSYDRLLLNPTGTLVGTFYGNHGKGAGYTLALYSAADGRRVGKPLWLGDCGGLGFVDDKTLVIANGRKLLRWKVPGEPEAFGPAGGFFYALLTTRPGLPVFGVCIDESVSALDVKTGERLWRTDGPLGLFTDGLALSPRGRLMASLHSPSMDSWQVIVVFEVATGRQLRMHWSDEEVDGLTFAPDESALFAFKGEDQREIVVYADGAVNPVRRLALPREIRWGLSMNFAPEGSWLDVIENDGTRVRLDPTSGRVLQRYKSRRKFADTSGIAVSANGKVAAAVAEDFTVVVWPLNEDGADGDREAAVPKSRRPK
jgi:hypothetical protein